MIYPQGDHGAGRSKAPMMPGAERRPDADDWVYVTTDINGAWLYAYDSTVDGEPAVYSVFPLSDIERDPEHGSRMPAYRCRSAVVLGADRQPPFSQEEAARKWLREDPGPLVRPAGGTEGSTESGSSR